MIVVSLAGRWVGGWPVSHSLGPPPPRDDDDDDDGGSW